MNLFCLAVVFILLSLPFLIFRLVRGPAWTDRLIAADMIGLSFAVGLLFLNGGESAERWNQEAVWIILAAAFVGTLGASLIIRQKEAP